MKQKITISQIIGIITLITLLSGFIIRYGSLPEAFAALNKKVDDYSSEIKKLSTDVTGLKVEQKYIKEKLDDTYQYIKSKL